MQSFQDALKGRIILALTDDIGLEGFCGGRLMESPYSDADFGALDNAICDVEPKIHDGAVVEAAGGDGIEAISANEAAAQTADRQAARAERQRLLARFLVVARRAASQKSAPAPRNTGGGAAEVKDTNEQDYMDARGKVKELYGVDQFSRKLVTPGYFAKMTKALRSRQMSGVLDLAKMDLSATAGPDATRTDDDDCEIGKSGFTIGFKTSKKRVILDSTSQFFQVLHIWKYLLVTAGTFEVTGPGDEGCLGGKRYEVTLSELETYTSELYTVADSGAPALLALHAEYMTLVEDAMIARNYNFASALHHALETWKSVALMRHRGVEHHLRKETQQGKAKPEPSPAKSAKRGRERDSSAPSAPAKTPRGKGGKGNGGGKTSGGNRSEGGAAANLVALLTDALSKAPSAASKE
jgi:hypothetical protein